MDPTKAPESRHQLEDQGERLQLADVHKAQKGDKVELDRVLTCPGIKRIVYSFCKNPHQQWAHYDKSVEDLHHEVVIKIQKELVLPRAPFVNLAVFFSWVKAITRSVYYSEFRKTDSLIKGKRLNVPEDLNLQPESSSYQNVFATPAPQLDDLLVDEEEKLWAVRKELLPVAMSKLSVAEREGLNEWVRGSALTRVARLLGKQHPEQARREIAKILAKLNRMIRELEISRSKPPENPNQIP